jgi:hypothetical protein
LASLGNDREEVGPAFEKAAAVVWHVRDVSTASDPRVRVSATSWGLRSTRPRVRDVLTRSDPRVRASALATYWIAPALPATRRRIPVWPTW